MHRSLAESVIETEPRRNGLAGTVLWAWPTSGSAKYRKILAERSADWMSVPGVVGTAIGVYSGEPCLRVMVARKTPQILRTIPERVQGFRVDVVETGIF